MYKFLIIYFTKIFFVTIFSIASCFYLLLVTKNYDLGLSHDSVSYLEETRKINCRLKRNSDSCQQLETHRPPGYPFFLSLTSSISQTKPIVAAKILNIVSLIVIIWFFNKLLARFDWSNRQIFFLNLFLISSHSFRIFLMVWSEPLFIAFLLISLHLFFSWIGSKKVQLLATTGILTGLMFIIRYAAVGFILGFCINIILFRQNIFKKITNLAIFVTNMAVIPIAWIIFTQLSNLATTNRQLRFHLFSANHLKSLVKTIKKWILPLPQPTFISQKTYFFILMAMALLIAAIFLKRKNRQQLLLHFKSILSVKNKKQFPLTVLMASYLLFILFSISLIDFHTPLNYRILAPLFPLFLILLGKTFFLNKLVFYLILVSYLAQGFFLFNSFFYEGSGYSGKVFKESEVLAKVQANQDCKIVTNGVDLVSYYKPECNHIMSLPAKLRPTSQKKNPNYQQELSKIKLQIEKNEYQLVYFDKISWRYYYPTSTELKNYFSGHKITRLEDGFIVK